MSLLGKITKKSFTVIVTLILTFIISPLIIIALFPIYLARRSAFLLSKVLRPDLGKLLTATSTIFSTDDIYGNPKFSVTILAHFKGCVDIEALKLKFVNEIIGVQEVRGELKNIELKQYPYKWMGFVFWKWDEKFDISNQIKYYEDGNNSAESKISLERVKEIEHELLLQPFHEKRSPWDFTVFRNLQSVAAEDETAIIFRFHHTLADGFSLLKLFCFEVMDESPSEFVPKSGLRKHALSQKLRFCVKCLAAPYIFAKVIVETYDRNKWKIPEKMMSKKWIAAVSDEVSIYDVKQVKTDLKVSVTAVILSAMTAALRNSMIKKNGKVPKYIHTGLTFPMKFHSDKLRNVLVVVFLRLPVGEQDPVKRLMKVDRNLRKLKDSVQPFVSYLGTVLIGSMFYWMIRPLVRLTPPTAGGTSFPGPKTKLSLFGKEAIDAYFAIGPLFGNIGVAFTTLTYNNNLKVRFMVNGSILNNKKEVEEINQDLCKEIRILKRHSGDHIV